MFKIIAAPTLLYGSETKKNLNKMQSLENKFLGNFKGSTILDKIRNYQIKSKLKIHSITNKIKL